MDNNAYLEKLISEISNQGVDTPNAQVGKGVQSTTLEDRDLGIIMSLERASGHPFSDEQKQILRHKGSASILACAGSGKTETSVNLIAKRILTGEVNPDKMVYVTYSKAGAQEMKDRLEKLLYKLGVKKEVHVRTLHSFFLQLLRTFGITHDIISDGKRREFIKEACKDAGFMTKDDELGIVDNLISYQVNNLLTDERVINSCVNTLDDLRLEQYSKIREGYAIRKVNNKLIDYDDMQSYLYVFLVRYRSSINPNELAQYESIKNYCKSLYDYFFIDEAQDVSKLQFEIVRAIITDSKNPDKLEKELVFIGDDDQCVIKGTQVSTDRGKILIEDVQVGDRVLTAVGNGELKYHKVDHISKKSHYGKVISIATDMGKVIRVTPQHRGYVKVSNDELEGDNYIQLIQYGKEGNAEVKVVGKQGIKLYKDELWTLRHKGERVEITYRFEFIDDAVKFYNNSYAESELVRKGEYAVLTDGALYKCIEFKDMQVGDIIPVYNEGYAVEDRIIIKDEEDYAGDVYDISVPMTRNFMASGVYVHNCIYEWRGSDPSIILSVGTTFNIKTFILSTNYRCKSEIVDYATTGVKCNSTRYNKSMQAFTQGGNVKIAIPENDNLYSMSKLAHNHIQYWINKGEKLSDIAVLARNNFHLAILSNMLLRSGIYCYLTDDMKLTKNYMFKDIDNLIELCRECWKHDIIKATLWKMCRFMSVGIAKSISDFINNSNVSVRKALGYILRYLCNRQVDFNETIKIPTQLIEKMTYSMRSCGKDTIDDLEVVYNAIASGANGDEVGCLKTLFFQYLHAADYLYKSKDKKRSIQGLCGYIMKLAQVDGYDGLIDFLRIAKQFESGNAGVIGERVTLSTVHSAKGREWKNVIMFACDNITQPSFDGIQKMVDDKVDDKDIFSNIEQERRLCYVGNTRAKENLLIITNKMPSMFILEALGCIKDNYNGRIYDTALNSELQRDYISYVDNYILNEASKYYYNAIEYRTDGAI